jgi:hypothetical protein
VKEVNNDQRTTMLIEKDFDAGLLRCPVRLLRFVSFDEELLERLLHPESLPPIIKRSRAPPGRSSSRRRSKRRRTTKVGAPGPHAKTESVGDEDGDQLSSDLSDLD